MGLRPKPPPHLRRQGEVTAKQKTTVSNHLLWFLELLTRFEPVTRSTPKTRCVFGGPGEITWGYAPNPRRTCGDRARSPQNKKPQ